MEEKTSFKHDWWSAGVILYQLCSAGEFPFQASTIPSLSLKIADKNIKAPELLDVNIPADIIDLCKGLLDKD